MNHVKYNVTLKVLNSNTKLQGIFLLLVFIFALNVCFIPNTLNAGEMRRVPAKIQAVMLVKLLNFEKSLNNRINGSTLKILILEKERNGDSGTFEQDIAKALRQLAKKKTVAQLTIEVREEQYSGPKNFKVLIKRFQPAVVYFSPLLAAYADEILESMKNNRILSFSDQESLCEKGVMVCFIPRHGQTKIMINYGAAKQEKIVFESKLLQICNVINS